MLNKFTSVQAFGPVVLARSRALRWLLDAKLTFFENPHAFLSVVALLIFLFFCLPYTLLLFVVGWLKYLPFDCASRLLVKFKPTIRYTHWTSEGQISLLGGLDNSLD